MMFFPTRWALACLSILAACHAGATDVGDAVRAARVAATRFGHVFVIVLENESFDDTFGAHSPAPYLSRDLPKQGVLLSEYYGTGHASLSNYLAMISGQAATPETRDDCEVFAPFVQTGVTPDGQAIGHGCVYPASVPTLVGQLRARGLSWRGYMEDMGNDPAREAASCGHPSEGDQDKTQIAAGPSARAPHGDQYATRHDPFVYFHSITDTADCARHVVPLERLKADLKSGHTPNFVFITPNLCHDGHDKPCKSLGADGKPEPGGLRSADAFLKEWVPKILASEAYRRDGLLIITFDEGDSAPVADGPGAFRIEYPGKTCCNQQPGPNLGKFPQTEHWENYTLVFDDFGGDRTGAVLLSPRLAAGKVAHTPFNHYALLRTLEQAFGIDEYLGYAGQPGLVGFFETGSDVPLAGSAGNTKFAQMVDEFLKDSLAISPVNASQAGYHQHKDPGTGRTIELDARLDDVGPRGVAAQETFYRKWRHRFQTDAPVASLDAQDAADHRLIDDDIALSLLDLEEIQSYKHNPTGYVELIGNAMFLPLTQEYASKEVRVGHVVARIGQIPRFIAQAESELVDSDPIFISTALEENEGNIDLIDSIASQITAGSPLKARYDKVAPAAKRALAGFDDWLKKDLAKRPSSRTWRLGKRWYDQKFRYVMETSVTPEQLLADAEARLNALRAEMLQLALPLYAQMYPGQDTYGDLPARERENKVISAVLSKISDEHPARDQLIEAVEADLDGIKQFIREKKIVSLSSRDNLKVIPTPEFMRGSYSVAGFHPAPPLEPAAEAQYWVTPIDPKMPAAEAESKLREYNNYALKWLTIHEALPGHYIQGEHADDVEPPTRRVLRDLFGNGAYVEGWAEYIADVMTEEGYLDHSPKFGLVRRKILLRAISNSILDIRMQTMNMTDEQAMDLMMNDTFQTQAEARGKLRRAKLTSTQLPTYFVGLRQWWELRRKYQAAKGSTFSLEEFHDKALNQGPLPIEYLEKIILPER